MPEKIEFDRKDPVVKALTISDLIEMKRKQEEGELPEAETVETTEEESFPEEVKEESLTSYNEDIQFETENVQEKKEEKPVEKPEEKSDLYSVEAKENEITESGDLQISDINDIVFNKR